MMTFGTIVPGVNPSKWQFQTSCTHGKKQHSLAGMGVESLTRGIASTTSKVLPLPSTSREPDAGCSRYRLLNKVMLVRTSTMVHAPAIPWPPKHPQVRWMSMHLLSALGIMALRWKSGEDFGGQGGAYSTQNIYAWCSVQFFVRGSHCVSQCISRLNARS